VTYPIEQQFGGLPASSVALAVRAGLSQVVVVFEDGTDIYWARQIVFERLAAARDSLPPDVEPELGPISTGLGEIFQYTLRGDGSARPSSGRSTTGSSPRGFGPSPASTR